MSSYSNNILFKPILFILLSSPLFSTNTGIRGHVFQDLPVHNTGNTLELNIYGIQEGNELGVADINVTAYPEKISTLTDSNGSWSLLTTKKSRIEFSNIPSYLKESPNSSAVKFAQIGEKNIDFALHNPEDYVSSINPRYVNNLQQNGTHIGSTLQALQTINYTDKGLNSDYLEYNSSIRGEGIKPEDTITMEDIGSVWGKAYQKNKKRLFVASMLQRHVGFSNTPADIYVMDYASNPAVLLGNFSLEGKKTSNSTDKINLGTVIRTGENYYRLKDNPLQSNVDFDAYSKVGKISYGGIDIDHHSNKLWLINLHQKGLISLDISGDFNSLSTAKVEQYPMESLKNIPSCKQGKLRPWAIKVHQGKGYIGTICDASASKSPAHLSADVISFDLKHPENGFKNELTIDLNYGKANGGWHAWEDKYVELNKTFNGTIYPEPILSDIEFDKNSNMYLSFMDRYATQLGTFSQKAKKTINDKDLEKAYSHGEILKICNNNGIYTQEGSETCPNLQTAYKDEYFNDHGGAATIDKESALGSLALIKGSEQLLFTAVDPHPEGKVSQKYWDTQGVETVSLKDGSIKNWYSQAMTDDKGLNSKANGIGDIELISNPAPLEIGDRIWKDSNSNGIQDANETGISGVKITLVCNGSSVNAISDASGKYIFSNDPKGDTTASYIYDVSQLQEGISNCLIIVPNIKGASKQTVLKELELTSEDQGEGSYAHQNNSDAINHENDAVINISATDIPLFGANNHSFDIGFRKIGTIKPIICQEMILKDDTQNANEKNATTNIDVLENDIGTKHKQQIKLLSLKDGQALWESKDQNITTIQGFETLPVEGEGQWSVLNNKIVFTALNSFDGKIPTPIFYIVEGKNCTEETKYTNIAKVMIDTPCHCPPYNTDSVFTFNIYSLLLLIFLTTALSYTSYRDKIA